MRALGAAVIGAAALWGCTSQRSSPPFAGGLPNLNTAKRAHGEVVFMQNCNQCHPSDAGGLGPALNNKPAPATAIKAVVRIGPGDMPSFGDADLSDADVDAVADYVVALREADDEAEDAREGD
jgi:mono/diheme cytochrome c family protein